MKEVNIYQVLMITNQGVDVLRVSKSKKLLQDFITEHRHQYIKAVYGLLNVEDIRGENSYTVIRAIDKEFLCCWKIEEVKFLKK